MRFLIRNEVLVLYELFPLCDAIFGAEHLHKRISPAHERSELAKQSGVKIWIHFYVSVFTFSIII